MKAQQGSLIPSQPVVLSADSLKEVASFAFWRAQSGLSRSAVGSEVSQLRSLARDSEQLRVTSLKRLREAPEIAAQLIESGSLVVSRSTVLTRIRAFEHFLQMGVSDFKGRQRIAAFRRAFPKRMSRGWFDAGVAEPGRKGTQGMPGPTLPPAALLPILEAAEATSPEHAARAALACFSGLENSEIVTLRWRDLEWRDEGTSYWQTKVRRRGKLSWGFIVGPGAEALLRAGLASKLDRNAFVLTGRAGGPLSERAYRDSLRSLCADAGWPRATRMQIVSAFAAWLRENGMDDHAIRETLGRRRAVTVDQMLARHGQLAAQVTFDSARLDLHT